MLGDRGVLPHPVIGVGDVHGGDAQEVNEGCIVAPRTQRAQAVEKKIVGLEGTGPAGLSRAPVLALGSPGDQAICRAATVEIPDPVVVDAEAFGAWSGDLTRRRIQSGTSLPQGPKGRPRPGPPESPS